MNAAVLVFKLREAGYAVELNALGRVEIAPEPPPDLLAALTRCKDLLGQALREQEDAAANGCLPEFVPLVGLSVGELCDLVRGRYQLPPDPSPAPGPLFQRPLPVPTVEWLFNRFFDHHHATVDQIIATRTEAAAVDIAALAGDLVALEKALDAWGAALASAVPPVLMPNGQPYPF